MPENAAFNLVGWEAIGDYLGVHANTARMWGHPTAKPRLPYYQIGVRGQIRAKKAEIDAWIQAYHAKIDSIHNPPEPQPGTL